MFKLATSPNLHVLDVIWSHDTWTDCACSKPQIAPQVLRSHLNALLGACETPKLLPRSLVFIRTHDPIKLMRMHGHSNMLPRPLAFVAVSPEVNKKHTGNQVVFVEYNLEWMHTPSKLLRDPRIRWMIYDVTGSDCSATGSQ